MRILIESEDGNLKNYEELTNEEKNEFSKKVSETLIKTYIKLNNLKTRAS